MAGKHCRDGHPDPGGEPRRRCDRGTSWPVPGTGAYTYAMASNYNRFSCPAVVFVRDGQARLVVRRETLDDVLSHDL